MITCTTVCWLRDRGKAFSRKHCTSSYPLEPSDSSGDLQERGWYILEGNILFTRSYQMGCLFKTHQSEQQVIAGNLPSLLWRAGISATGLSGGGFLNVNSLFCQTSTRKCVLRGPQNPPCRAPHRLTNPKRYFLYHTSTIFSEQPGQTYFQAETGLFLGHPHPVALHSYQGCPKGLFCTGLPGWQHCCKM